MSNTTTPFPSTLLKSASPSMAIASPVERNERAVVPLALGPFPLAQGSGNLLTGLDLSRLAPFGGRILGIDAFWTTAGAGAGAAGTINAELDGVNLTGGVLTLALATSGLGAVNQGSAITALNAITPGLGILDLEYVDGTAYTAGAVMIVLYVEVYARRAIATGVIGEHIVSRPGLLESVVARLAEFGSAGRRNGVAILRWDR